jgi:hypothetical protein
VAEITPQNAIARADQAGAQEDFTSISFRPVTPGFFDAMGVPVLAGSLFDPTQTEALMNAAMAGEDVTLPMVISESLAGQLWPEGEPVGRSVVWGQPGGPSMTVIGVVGDLLDLSFPLDPRPTAYLPHRFAAFPTMTLVMRVQGNPASVTAGVREAIWSVDTGLPIPQPTLMGDALGSSLSAPRLNMLLMGIFSASALLLAAVALFGITALTVAQRTREIGVRVALGAPKGEVIGMVLRRALLLVGVGGAVGLVGAFVLTRFMEGLLFGVGARDPLTLAAVLGLLAGVTMVATLVPAARALRVDPTIALQAD